jgi:hypothetical protein
MAESAASHDVKGYGTAAAVSTLEAAFRFNWIDGGKPTSAVGCGWTSASPRESAAKATPPLSRATSALRRRRRRRRRECCHWQSRLCWVVACDGWVGFRAGGGLTVERCVVCWSDNKKLLSPVAARGPSAWLNRSVQRPE